MSDLISRSKAIECIKNIVEDKDQENITGRILTALYWQPAECAWIPVEERLPDTEERVMCCTETKKGNKNITIGYYMDGAWRCGMNSNVTAWMPLPEPYTP